MQISTKLTWAFAVNKQGEMACSMFFRRCFQRNKKKRSHSTLYLVYNFSKKAKKPSCRRKSARKFWIIHQSFVISFPQLRCWDVSTSRTSKASQLPRNKLSSVFLRHNRASAKQAPFQDFIDHAPSLLLFSKQTRVWSGRPVFVTFDFATAKS